MITAEELIEKSGYDWGYKEVKLKEMMIEFTKMHVKEALDSRDRLYEAYYADEIKFTKDNKKFIENSYSLENIK